MQRLNGYFLFFGFVFFLALAACKTTDEKKSNFYLQGTIQGAAGDSIFVEIVAAYQNVRDTFLIASTRIDDKGYFSMKGNIRGLGRYHIRLGKENPKIIPITPEPGNKIKLMTYKENFESNPGLQGAVWTNTANKYFRILSEMNPKISTENLLKFIAEEIRANPSNPFHIVLTEHLTPPIEAEKLQEWNSTNLNLLSIVSAGFNSTYGPIPATKGLKYKDSLSQEIYKGFQQKKSRQEMIKNGALMAPDFILLSITGEKYRLSEHRGKTILLYFWGLEFPNGTVDNKTISDLQKRQNNRFEVVSISCDKNIGNWKKAIQEFSFSGNWQLSDAKGSINPGAINGRSILMQQYALGDFPHSVLINGNGQIIAEGLKGEELMKRIEPLIK